MVTNLFPHFLVDRICVIFDVSRFKDFSVKGKKYKTLYRVPASRFLLTVVSVEPRESVSRLLEAYVRYRSLRDV